MVPPQVYKDDWTRGSSTFHWPSVPMALPNSTSFRVPTPIKQGHFKSSNVPVIPGTMTTINRPATDQVQWHGVEDNRPINDGGILPDLLNVTPQTETY